MQGEEAERLAWLLQDIQRSLRTLTDRCLAEHGVPFAKAAIQRQLGSESGLTVSELSRRLGLSKGYLSVTLDRLVQDGSSPKFVQTVVSAGRPVRRAG